MTPSASHPGRLSERESLMPLCRVTSATAELASIGVAVDIGKGLSVPGSGSVEFM